MQHKFKLKLEIQFFFSLFGEKGLLCLLSDEGMEGEGTVSKSCNINQWIMLIVELELKASYERLLSQRTQTNSPNNLVKSNKIWKINPFGAKSIGKLYLHWKFGLLQPDSETIYPSLDKTYICVSANETETGRIYNFVYQIIKK